jgi:hypothetical protein
MVQIWLGGNKLQDYVIIFYQSFSIVYASLFQGKYLRFLNIYDTCRCRTKVKEVQNDCRFLRFNAVLNLR